MKIFTVYLKENSNPFEDSVFIEEGFSWLGFVFNVFWLVYHRLWMQVVAFMFILLVVVELKQIDAIQDSVYFILCVGLYAYVGFAGRDFIRKKLEKDGYKFTDIVIAKSVDEAQYSFVKSTLKQQEKLDSGTKKSKD